jgi:hypothetical protein
MDASSGPGTAYHSGVHELNTFEKESVIFQIEMKPGNTGTCIEKV